jgi:superfamily II DNA or RNA helicase
MATPIPVSKEEAILLLGLDLEVYNYSARNKFEEYLGMKSGAFENLWWQLTRQNWMVEIESQYSWDDNYRFNFARFAEVADKFDTDFIKKHWHYIKFTLLTRSRNLPGAAWVEFVRALARFRESGAVPDANIFTDLLKDEMLSPYRVKTYGLAIATLIGRSEWREFFRNMPVSCTFFLFVGFLQRSDPTTLRMLEHDRSFFNDFMPSDNRGYEIKNWFFLYCDYFMTGWQKNPERGIEPGVGEASAALFTMSAIEKGDFKHASKVILTCLKVVSGGDTTRFFSTAVMNNILGIALYLDRGSAGTIRRIAAMLKRIRSEDARPERRLLTELLEKAQNPEYSLRFGESYWANILKAGRPEDYLELCAELRIFGSEDARERLHTLMKKLPEGFSPFFHREILSAMDPDSEEAEAMNGMLASKPLLNHCVPQTMWELGLDRLEAIAKALPKPKNTAKLVRMIYVVDREYLEVEPYEQRSKDGVNWTLGRKVPVSTFAKGTPAMDEVDYRIASFAVKDGRTMHLGGSPVLLELAGTGRTYRMQDEELIPYPVVRDRLGIQVVRTAKKAAGFEIRTSADRWDPDVLKMAVYMPQNINGELHIYEHTERDAEILKMLKLARRVPESAKEKLTGILEQLSSAYQVSSDLLKESEVVKTVESSDRIVYQIQPDSTGEAFAVHCFIRPFAGADTFLIPGVGLKTMTMKSGGKPVCVERSLDREMMNASKMDEILEDFSGMKEGERSWRLTLPECLDFMEAVRSAGDIASIEWPEGAKFNVSHRPLDYGDLQLKISSIDNWFSLEGSVMLDGATQLKVNEILDKLNDSVGRFIRLSDTEFVAVSQKLRRHLEYLRKVAAEKRGRLQLSAFNSEVIEELEEEGAEVKSDKAYKALRKNIQDAEERDFAVPEALNADLRAYQAEGFEWMARLAHWGAGAVLSDDMGLGKTVQTIALLLARKKAGPSLVVLPTAVLFNWKRELERFAPSLRVADFNQADREALLSDLSETDAVLVTYGVMTSEIEKLSEVAWNVVVLDEAHTIKNRLTQTSKAVMKLKSAARVLLSGTPIQNHLSEIWNLFEFANPGLLGSYQQFGERFIVPIEKFRNKDAQSLLKRIISPFILRRTKSDVLEELPEKTELTVPVTLTDAEMAVYENIRTKTMEGLENGDINPIEALSALTKLRQAACHPRLVNPKLALPSSKSAVFMALAEDLIENKHRVLVFSQFTSHLALIREELDAKKIPYLYLDGSHTAGQRKKLVEEFQGGDAPLFLISLKAGGLGLNLTGADYVIHLDPWWNPAVEDQASDRAYRIGQKRPVTIYKLIAANTIEEKIIDLHTTKKNLADALLEGADVAKKLTREEILGLLQAANA